MRLAVAVLALAGCSNLLGLDDIPLDQGALSVRGKLTTRRVLNSPTRLPYTADDTPVGKPPAGTFVELDDQSRRVLAWNADDTFVFDRERLAQPYRFVIPGSFTEPTLEYQLTGSQLAILDRQWGRAPAERTTAMAGTAVSYTFATPPAPAVTGALYLDSSGLWTQTAIAGSVPTNESFSLPWAAAQAAPAARPVALLDAESQHDRLYYVLYTTAAGATTSLLTRYRFDDVSLKDGTTTPITSQNVYTVQPDTCVMVDAPRAEEIQRITAAGYVDQAPAAGAWRLLAVPVLAMGTDVAFPLAYDAGATHFMAQPIDFGMPFTGYDLLLQLEAAAPHVVTAPGATAGTLIAYGSDQYLEPPTTAASVNNTECGTQAVMQFPGVQLPTAPLLDGFPLDRDQPIQPDRTRLAKLTWTTSQGMPPELYRAELFEVAADASLATELQARAIWYTTNQTPDGAPQVLVDPALLEAGKSYVIEIADIVGQPGAPAGDLSVLHFPYAIGYSYTGLLEVAN